MNTLDRLKATQARLQEAADLLRDAQALRRFADGITHGDCGVNEYRSVNQLDAVLYENRMKTIDAALEIGCVALAEAKEIRADVIQRELLNPNAAIANADILVTEPDRLPAHVPQL